MKGTLDTLELPDEMIWLDEAKWSAVAQSTSRALSGSLIVEEATMLQGRPMTIGGDNCWAPWALVQQLQALTHEAGKEMTLALSDGRSFTVIWAHDQNGPIEITRIYERQPEPQDWCRLTLHFYIVKEL